MTKIQTMHCRVLHNLRHTSESDWHLWNPMGGMGPFFFAILDLKYYWPNGIFRNPTLTTWGSCTGHYLNQGHLYLYICVFVMSWYFCWQKPTPGHLGRPRCRPAQPSQSCPSCQKTKAAARSQKISKNPPKNCPKSPTRVTARGDFLAPSRFLLLAFSCQLQFH